LLLAACCLLLAAAAATITTAVATFSTEGQAVQLANDSEFGLAGAVISADEARCKRVAEALQVRGSRGGRGG
jgi:hypothetical protein